MIKPSIDHSNKFGAIRNQGLRSTCLACATSDVHAAELRIEPLSAEYLFYYAAQKQLPIPHDDGLYLDAVNQALFEDGQCLERHYPYLDRHGMADPLPRPPGPFPQQTFKAEVEIKPDAIGKLLQGGITPILISYITRKFQYASAANDVVGFDNSDVRVGVHAVIAVALGNSGDGHSFIKVRNSWGPKWGSQGHAWLSNEYLVKNLIQTAALKI